MPSLLPPPSIQYDFAPHAISTTCLQLGRKNEKLMVTGGDDRRVNVWSLGATAPTTLLSLSGHASAITCVGFDSEEHCVVAGSTGGTIKLWDLAHQKVIRTLLAHRTAVDAVAYHPFGDYFASSADRDVKLWDIRRKGCVHVFHDTSPQAHPLQFSPDGQWLLTCSPLHPGARLWDLRTGTLLHVFAHGARPAVVHAAFHPDELLLATVHADGTAAFWDMDTFAPVASTAEMAAGGVAGPPPVCRRLAFHPDGVHAVLLARDLCALVAWEPAARCVAAGPVQWHVSAPAADAHVHRAAPAPQLCAAAYAESMVSVLLLDVAALAPSPRPPPARHAGDAPGLPAAAALPLPTAGPPPPPSGGLPSAAASLSHLPLLPPIASSVVSGTPRGDPAEPTESAEAAAGGSPWPVRATLVLPAAESVLPVAESVLPAARPAPAPAPAPAPPTPPPPPPRAHAGSGPVSLAHGSRSTTASSEATLTPAASVTPTAPSPTGSDASAPPPPGGAGGPPPGQQAPEPEPEPELPPAGLAERVAAQLKLETTPRGSAESLSSTLTPARLVGLARVPAAPVAAPLPAASAASAAAPPASVLGAPCFAAASPATHAVGTSPMTPPVSPFIPCSGRMPLHLALDSIVRGSPSRVAAPARAARSVAWTPSVLSEAHPQLVAILTQRLHALQGVRRRWDPRATQGALVYAASTRQHGVYIDVLRTLRAVPQSLTLDACVIILPWLTELLFGSLEDYLVTACTVIKLVLTHFATLISTTLASFPTVGMDLSREERIEKCHQCRNELLAIQQVLKELSPSPGAMGHLIRDTLHAFPHNF